MSAVLVRDGRVRLGGPYAKRARRAELTEIITGHMETYPHAWLTAVDLARVIAERYLDDPHPPTMAGPRYGRSNVVMSILRDLHRQGKVARRDHPAHRDSSQWRLA